MGQTYTVEDAFVTKCEEHGMMRDEFKMNYVYKKTVGNFTLTCSINDDDQITLELIKGKVVINEGTFYPQSKDDFHFFGGCLDMQINKIKRGVAIY